MAGILVQTREASPPLHGIKPQGAPRVVPNLPDQSQQLDKLPPTPIGLSGAAGEPPRCIETEPSPSIGSLLYLGSVGLIAAGIVAVFFGAGFSLLVRTAGGTISGSVARTDPEIMSFPPSLDNVAGQTFLGRPSTHENNGASPNSAALPAPAEATAIDRKEDAPHVYGVLPPKAPTATPVVPANAPVSALNSPASNSPAPTAPAPPSSELSNAEITELLDHGDTLLRNGDVASARLFYERVVNAGDGRAALRLGATFDPAFLGRIGIGKLQADPAQARSWYSRALDLGAVEAKRQLNSLDTRQGNRFQ